MKAILFDLDGTLLPMDQDKFMAIYLKQLSLFVGNYISDSNLFINALLQSIDKMLNNDGTKTNEEAFWLEMLNLVPAIARQRNTFTHFYETMFIKTKEATMVNNYAKMIIDYLKEKEILLILATNPVFPRIATEKRTAWANIDANNFSYITTYEDQRFCKPNKAYYVDLLAKYNLKPADCLMVGNDLHEDGIAMELGMDFYLITDCLINTKQLPLPEKNGSLASFYEYIKAKVI